MVKLIKNDNVLLEDVNGIVESVKKVIQKVEMAISSQSEIKGIIPNEQKIIEALSVMLRDLIEEKILPILKENITREKKQKDKEER